MKQQEILLAKEQWDRFVANLSPESQKNLGRYADAVNSLDLYTHLVIKDYVRFDQVVNTLPKQFLFDDNIIHLVYQCYVLRGLPDAALVFLDEAEAYHQNQGLTTSINFLVLRTILDDHKLHNRLRTGLQLVQSIKPRNIPAVIPPSLNGQYNFHEFVLGEIINALRIIAKKKAAIRTEKENLINDILLAVLVLRFPLWGWVINDQERSGKSASGRDAGEVDLTIKAAGNDLSLIEAFILHGLDTGKIEEHATKCFNYNKSLPAYYLVIYYLGSQNNFESSWISYKEAITKAPFESEYSMDKTAGLAELSSKFQEVSNLKIGKTIHRSKELYHLMVDLS